MRGIRRVLLLALAATAAYAALALAAGAATESQGSQYHAPVTSRWGVVASESPAAARVGRRVLEQGGNAIDAAAATVFALTAARPQSCGIGGGGFMVYRGANGHVDSLDFRETAPRAWTHDTLQHPGLHKVFTGHLTNGVPGVVAGMAAALKRYGTLPLSRAVAPAEQLARQGVTVRQPLAGAMAANIARIKLFPATARLYLKAGEPYREGDVLRNPQLAASLDLIRRDGPRAFYSGPIAQKIVADQKSTASTYHDAGLMTLADLKAYHAVWRDPVRGTYRGFGITGAPP